MLVFYNENNEIVFAVNATVYLPDPTGINKLRAIELANTELIELTISEADADDLFGSQFPDELDGFSADLNIFDSGSHVEVSERKFLALQHGDYINIMQFD
jgi:hypothetical protein